MLTGTPMHTPATRLILASSSTYRRALLGRLMLPFEVAVPDLDERPHIGELPEATAIRLAEKKASCVARAHPGTLIIGSDQVATLDGDHIGKPGSHAKALAQLQAMQGRKVIFHTALCLHDGRNFAEPQIQIANVQTAVTFRTLPAKTLDTYLKIEQPYDCAGSAKNEGLGIALIERCESEDPTALIGLPLIALVGMLQNVGISVFENPKIS